jgi:hypothetical protein
MPKVTKNEILEMVNPYQQLVAEDNLAENCEVFEELTAKEKRALATKIVLGCPHGKRNNLHHQINALKQIEESPQCFRQILATALVIRQRIHAMENHHPSPYKFLLGEEFNADLYNEFSELVSILFNNKQTPRSIAENLAILTPPESILQLSRNVRAAFSGTSLPGHLGQAFLAGKLLDTLRSEAPLKFFDSPEFTNKLFFQFPSLVTKRLQGSEHHIASRLSGDPLANHAKIIETLQDLSFMDDTPNPFRLIHAQVCAAVQSNGAVQTVLHDGTDSQNESQTSGESEGQLTPSQDLSATNRYGFHARPKTAPGCSRPAEMSLDNPPQI